MDFKRLSPKHKNNKALYYSKNYLRQLFPTVWYERQLPKILKSFEALDLKTQEYILNRVNYYNKLSQKINLSNKSKQLKDIHLNEEIKTYFFDFFEDNRYFKRDLKVRYLFGDIKHIPEEPSFVKSRPIDSNNENAILLKWNKVRHFMFIKKDKHHYNDKKNKLVGRGNIYKYQPQRVLFFEKYFNHPVCNIGKVNKDNFHPEWLKPRMTIDEQLKYKFILCLEGNDVASNLKWVMSSNSLAVMPQPKYETWFMEGTLIPDFHYVAIKNDYSDLESKLQYYINNPEKAHEIIKNAHNHVSQFKNSKYEKLISLMVIEKYFKYTNQL